MSSKKKIPVGGWLRTQFLKRPVGFQPAIWLKNSRPIAIRKFQPEILLLKILATVLSIKHRGVVARSRGYIIFSILTKIVIIIRIGSQFSKMSKLSKMSVLSNLSDIKEESEASGQENKSYVEDEFDEQFICHGF